MSKTFSEFDDGEPLGDDSELVGYNPPAVEGDPYLRWTAAELADYISATLSTVSTGDSSVNISSLASDPDIDVVSGSNDEFTQNTSGAPSGWTAIPSGTPDSVNTSGFYSNLYMMANGGGGSAVLLKGIYKNSPVAPFTVTCKLSDASVAANHDKVGLFLGETSAAGKFTVLTVVNTGSFINELQGSDFASRATSNSSFVGMGFHNSGAPPLYLRMVVNSTTDVDYQYSYGGYIWTDLSNAHNPSMTIATVGLFVSGGDASAPAYALFDWIRFT